MKSDLQNKKFYRGNAEINTITLFNLIIPLVAVKSYCLNTSLTVFNLIFGQPISGTYSRKFFLIFTNKRKLQHRIFAKIRLAEVAEFSYYKW